MTDLLVIGSGAAGMTAALTAANLGLKVVLVEKAAVYGGSTALSGGGVWVPNNPTLRRNGIVGSEEDVLRYLDEIVGDDVTPERKRALVEEGPKMIQALENWSPHLRFSYCPGYADYHPEEPGGRPEGRTIECLPFNMNELGDDAKDMRKSELATPTGLYMTSTEFCKITMMKRTREGKRMFRNLALRAARGMLTRKPMVALGTALIGRLRLALKEAGVAVWLNTELTDFVRDEQGRVTGAKFRKDGADIIVVAKKGVILASGGFDHNQSMRDRYLPETGRPVFSAGAKSNVGDGIEAGQRLGARTELMDDAWWMPVTRKPDGSVFCLVSERCIPRSIIVGPDGDRFTNESSPYVNFVHDQIDKGFEKVWFIMDQTARERYQYGGNLPGKDMPGSWYKAGIVKKADTLEDLGAQIGVPGDKLAASVRRWNEMATRNKDEDFVRGDSAYDRYYGDPTLPNPNMDQIDTGPFFAIEVVAGDLGTKGGLLTDEHARVLDEDGKVIDGLYAAGNCSAAVMGHEYAGAGATIGPAMTFGWVAAHHAAGLRRAGDDGAGRENAAGSSSSAARPEPVTG